MAEAADVRARYETALERLMIEVREDRNILAAILCGSLSHDQVWEKSDIDLVLVTIDDVTSHGVVINADDINVHTSIMTRSAFKQRLDGATRNSFGHSLFAKATLIFARDPSIEQLFEELNLIGERDTTIQQLQSLSELLASLYKAEKWFYVKDDLNYAALWLLFTANSLAQMVVGREGQLVAREVIADAMKIEPELFQVIYIDLLNRKKTKKAVATAIDAVNAYIDRHRDRVCAPILDYLRETGEPRSVTELNHHFHRNYNIESVVLVCEWLADSGLIDKVSTPVKLTKKSRKSIDELAFFYLNPNGF